MAFMVPSPESLFLFHSLLTQGSLMMKHLAVCAAIGAMLTLSASSAQAGNLLSDAGFESGAFVDDGSGLGKWQPFADGSAGNTSEIGASMPRTDVYAAELNLVNANGFAGFFQDIPAVPGVASEWSAWVKDALGNGGAAVEMRIEYRDSVANTEISRTGNLVPTLTTTDYELVTLTDVVPAGADTARVVFAIQSFGTAPPQQIFVDDAYATAPEPTAAVIALLGLAPLARRRR